MKVYSFVAAKGPIFDFSADVLDFFRHLEQNHGFPMRDQYMLSKRSSPVFPLPCTYANDQ
jgi:hypothetical protein